MKKALLIIVVTILSLFSASLYSAEPLVRFYLQDGSTKQYNLSEIANIQFPNAPETLQLQVFTNDSKTFYYPVQLIDTITFSIGQYSNQYVNLWHDGFKWDFAIHKIDSISIYYTPYTAVTIGTQHWIYRNLNVDHYRNGELIPEVKDSVTWANLTTGAWCYYNNDSALGDVYGKIYNGYAVRDPHYLVPDGWHIPTDSEWRKLSTYLGGENVAGDKLKETGLSNWLSPNAIATNESGFSALLGGYRYVNGWFFDNGSFSSWWSSTESSASYSWSWYLYYDFTDIFRCSNYNGYGFSVRCIKD